MDMELFKKAMEIGYYFEAEIDSSDDRVNEWTGCEDCPTFAKLIIDCAENDRCNIHTAFHKYADESINRINDKSVPVEDHMWDEYCKGFLAGEIIGYPTEENMKLVEEAEKLWLDDSYGYYQEVLEEVIGN